MLMKKEVRNSNGKLVCVIDENSKTVEIKHGQVTTIIKSSIDGKFLIKEKK